MDTNTKRFVIGASLVAAGVAAGLLIAHGMERKEDFDRMIEARDTAPDKEKFDRDFKAMADWMEDYKRKNPGANDDDAGRAFREAWERDGR
jgi:hypothetical protein